MSYSPVSSIINRGGGNASLMIMGILQNPTQGHMTLADTKPKLIHKARTNLPTQSWNSLPKHSWNSSANSKPELITITKMGAKIPMSHRL